MLALMQRTRVEKVHLMVDPPTGLRAIIAIHGGRALPALGGCRYLAYPDDDSAVADAIRLSEVMTFKAALAGLPFSGGKAVILRGPHVEDRARLFEAFGRFVDSLQGATSPRWTVAPALLTWTVWLRPPAMSPVPRLPATPRRTQPLGYSPVSAAPPWRVWAATTSKGCE